MDGDNSMSINYAQEFVNIALQDVGKNGRTICNWYPLSWGEAWCAASCSYWANKLGQKYGVSILGKIIPKTAGAGCFAREGVPNGMGTWIPRGSGTPKVGDLITFRWGGWYSDKYHSDHVGVVQKVANGYVYTIEGNAGASNTTSSVKQKVYSLNFSCINGYYRPNWNLIKGNATNTTGDEEMNFKKGDKSDGVLAYKSLIRQANALGIITENCDTTNSFGGGTYKATLEIQKKFKLERDGIAGKNTITALRNAIEKKQKSLIQPTEIASGWGIGIRMAKICLRALQSKGIIKTKPDTKYGYGSGTSKAIKEVQAVANIKQDGVIGTNTANAIEKLLID